MEYITVLVTLGGIGWLIARQEKLFDKIEAIGNRLNRTEEKNQSFEKMMDERFRNIGKVLDEKFKASEDRISGLESRMIHLENMLQTIVSTLLGSKTGT